MMWDLPTTVEACEKVFKIRNKCDFRVVLDVINVLNDEELDEEYVMKFSLFIFYEDLTELENFKNEDKEKYIKAITILIEQMFLIINNGEKNEPDQINKPVLMNWQHDFKYLVAPISRVIGYDVRTSEKYTHWWTFLSGYMEIGESTFATIVSIRDKNIKGKKLEKWEREFYSENRKIIDLPIETRLTREERKLLKAKW